MLYEIYEEGFGDSTTIGNQEQAAINKEILGEVLGYIEILEQYNVEIKEELVVYEYINYCVDNIGSDGVGDPTAKAEIGYINIHELANKYKEWILSEEFEFSIDYTDFDVTIHIKGYDGIVKKTYVTKRKESDTPELDCLIKSCNWILENKKNEL